MACFTARLDDKNDNTVLTQFVAPPMYPGTGTKIYVAWCEKGNAAGSNTHNRAVKINWFDWSDHSVGTPVTVEAYDATKDMDYIDARVLTDGTMLVAYGSNGPRVRESTDSGATWATVAAPAGTFGGATGVPACCGLVTDGTNVWLHVQQTAGGGGENDVTTYARTGAGTWAAGVKTNDTPGSNIIPFFNFQGPRQGGSYCGHMFSATVGLIIGDYADQGSPAEYHTVAVLRTTDGWTGPATVINIATYAGAFPRYPSLAVGTDGRLRAMWIDNTSGRELPVLAYSDDQGLTWTVIGTPAIFADANWDNSFDRAMWLGKNNNILCGAFDAAHYPDVRHYTFNGGDSLTGWTETTCTNLAYVIASNTTGNGFVANDAWFRVFNKNVSGVLQVNVLWVENVDTSGGGGAPPTITESPTGTDQPNVYLRFDIADEKGWSAHELQLTHLFGWPEGDYTTERRKHELMGLAASVDPTVQNPAYVAAIYKIDDRERWSKEGFVDDGTGNLTLIEEPFLMRWHGAQLNVGETGSTNLLRGVYLRYRREGLSPFSVQVWLDSVLIDTQSIPAAWPDPEEFWWPIPRSQNAGSRIQLRVEDNIPADLIVESYAVKFRPKHWRMRNV